MNMEYFEIYILKLILKIHILETNELIKFDFF